MHVEHICFVNGFLVISICIAYKCMFFFSNSDVSKNRRTVWLAGHLSLKSHGYHGILPKLCQSGSHCPKGGEFGTWFMWDIKKGFFFWYVIYVRYRKRSRSLRDLYQMILVIYQEMGLFDTWFIKISGCGIDWYIIFVKKRSGIVGCLIFEMSGKEIDSTWSMWMGRA